jgi:ABC-type multidrug transport system fused ATPase/permease subunit
MAMTIQDDEGFEGVEFDTPVGTFREGRGGGYRWAEGGDEFRSIRRKVRKRMAFFRMLLTFAWVLAILALVDWVTGGGWWVQWVALIVGVLVALRFLSIFVFDSLIGREAERRMIERELRKREGSG